MTDSDLIAGLRSGREDAFDAIFRTHYVALVGFAQSLLGDRGGAEEAAQDVMLELWRRRATLRIETSLQAYLFRATRNRALNAIRHERIVARAEPAIAALAPPARAADRDTLEAEIDRAVREAIDQLPPRCREVFQLSRHAGLTYAEIAITMEISVKTVEAQMGKALRVLRERLRPWLPESEPDESDGG